MYDGFVNAIAGRSELRRYPTCSERYRRVQYHKCLSSVPRYDSLSISNRRLIMLRVASLWSRRQLCLAGHTCAVRSLTQGILQVLASAVVQLQQPAVAVTEPSDPAEDTRVPEQRMVTIRRIQKGGRSFYLRQRGLEILQTCRPSCCSSVSSTSPCR